MSRNLQGFNICQHVTHTVMVKLKTYTFQAIYYFIIVMGIIVLKRQILSFHWWTFLSLNFVVTSWQSTIEIMISLSFILFELNNKCL